MIPEEDDLLSTVTSSALDQDFSDELPIPTVSLQCVCVCVRGGGGEGGREKEKREREKSERVCIVKLTFELKLQVGIYIF